MDVSVSGSPNAADAVKRPRLSVLLSAFACEPGVGSEPEVGWQWAMRMARFHDLTVLTQAKNQPAIERAVTALPASEPRPRFVYHAMPRRIQALRRNVLGFKIHYMLWQREARKIIAGLHAESRFDLTHHVTFAAYRYPAAIWGHGVPAIWGPIGGMESIPFPLLPWGHPGSLFVEGARNLANVVQGNFSTSLARRARASALILVTTVEMEKALRRIGFAAEIMAAIGLSPTDAPPPAHRAPQGPLKLIYTGNLLALKGLDLALEALQRCRSEATFTIVGDGTYAGVLRKLVAKLGLARRVTFTGRLPREQVLGLYREHDLLVFPSLHDTGGYSVLEAMSNQLPVVCLDCGGPAVAVGEGCGVKVPLGSRPAIIDGLAAALAHYDRDRAALVGDGRHARETVLRNYDWSQKAERMNRYYWRAAGRELQD